MSFFDKLKNVLFEDDEETIVEEEKKKEEPKKEEVRFSSQSSSTPEKKEEPKKEPSVFQSFDEEEFDRIAAINKNRLLERDRKAREEKEKEEEKRRLEARQERETLNAGYRRYEELRYGTSTATNKETKEEPKKDIRTSEIPKESGEYRQNIYNKPLASKEPVKKFTPSPVISPVYGVLDKNYRKEDILPRASSEGTLPKIMDVDNVRKKAFGFLEKNIDVEEAEPLKDFQGENEMQMADISKELDADEEIGKTTRLDISDVKKIEEDIKAKEEPKEPTVKSDKNDEEDSLEKDLFNLIDSMYESREDK